jgi:hypothetical protein
MRIWRRVTLKSNSLSALGIWQASKSNWFKLWSEGRMWKHNRSQSHGSCLVRLNFQWSQGKLQLATEPLQRFVAGPAFTDLINIVIFVSSSWTKSLFVESIPCLGSASVKVRRDSRGRLTSYGFAQPHFELSSTLRYRSYSTSSRQCCLKKQWARHDANCRPLWRKP